MARIGTPASARGTLREARMPVRERSRGPMTLRQHQPFSAFQLEGRESSGKISDSSSSVRVTDQKDVEKTQSGIVSSGPSRHTANRSGCRKSDSRFMNAPHLQNNHLKLYHSWRGRAFTGCWPKPIPLRVRVRGPLHVIWILNFDSDTVVRLEKLAPRCSTIISVGETHYPFASELCGLLPVSPSAPEMTQDLRKSRSSLLNHIFSTILAIKPSSAQNWVCSCSGPQGVVVEKIYIRAQSSFSDCNTA